jgi:hypothetical protein
MRETPAYPPPHELGDVASPAIGGLGGDVEVPGGMWRLGATNSEGFIFDNEKWAHAVELRPFRIARAPVTNREFAAFVEAGGYRAREFCSDAGWAWRDRQRAERPVYWLPKTEGVWTWRRYDRTEVLPADAPLSSSAGMKPRPGVAGRSADCRVRPEWEAAAIGEPNADNDRLPDVKRVWPWGNVIPTRQHANLALRSTRRGMSGRVRMAMARSVAGRWSAIFGNGQPLTSCRFQDSPLIITKTMPSRGSARERCCAAVAGRRAPGSLGRRIEISFLPIAMIYSPASVPVLLCASSLSPISAAIQRSSILIR